MRGSRAIDDLEAIEQLIRWAAAMLRRDGTSRGEGLSEAARLLTRDSDVEITPQQVHQWRIRGCVAAHKRLLFRRVFNKTARQKKRRLRLPLSWLATPAQRHNGGRDDGGESSQPATPAQERKSGKRRAARSRPQLDRVGAA